MKTIFFKKLWSKALLVSLALLSFGKDAFAQNKYLSYWGQPMAPKIVSTDISEVAMNLLKVFIVTPFIVLGIIIWGTYFYYRINKKDLKKIKHWILIGKIIIIILLLTFLEKYFLMYSNGTGDFVINVFFLILALGAVTLILILRAILISLSKENKTPKVK